MPVTVEAGDGAYRSDIHVRIIDGTTATMNVIVVVSTLPEGWYRYSSAGSRPVLDAGANRRSDTRSDSVMPS
jgi:hypothetical protein